MDEENDDVSSLRDDLGPEKVIYLYDVSTQLRAIVTIDNVALGPAIGGVRMAPDVSLTECFRLSRAMTLKNAAAGLDHGGGKSVIFGNPRMPTKEKTALIRAFARGIRDLADYIPGPDMGTDEQCMGWVHTEIGRALGLPRKHGGIPLDEIGATGWGVLHAVKVATEFQGFPLKGARVVVQGFGAVGGHAARFLTEEGALVVGIANIDGTLYAPEGLDVERLLKLRDAGENLQNFPNAEKLPKDAVLDLPCEIWIPAARPDVVNEANVHRLQTRLVAQGANIPFTEGAEKALHDKGVLVLPDFITNAGGVICAAMEYSGFKEEAVFPAIEQKIRTNISQVLRSAENSGQTPREAAMMMAKERVKQAMNKPMAA